MISTSPDRGKFNLDCETNAVTEGRKTAEEAAKMIEIYEEWCRKDAAREQDPEWQRDNMEYDLRTTDWILEKVRSSDAYAQNLYAAMCNRDFVKADTWHLLKEIKWGCSWRYAGGIIAHMQQKGDYIDWYCSGIGGVADYDSDIVIEGYVPEGHVTEEIRADLLRLGWVVLDEDK